MFFTTSHVFFFQCPVRLKKYAVIFGNRSAENGVFINMKPVVRERWSIMSQFVFVEMEQRYPKRLFVSVKK